jgi:hypothetical protein
MSPKPEVPKVIVTGGNGRYLLACRACGWRREVFAKKVIAHQYAERHRRRTHAKNVAGTVTDLLGTTDSIDIELTTTNPEEDSAA